MGGGVAVNGTGQLGSVSTSSSEPSVIAGACCWGSGGGRVKAAAVAFRASNSLLDRPGRNIPWRWLDVSGRYCLLLEPRMLCLNCSDGCVGRRLPENRRYLREALVRVVMARRLLC